MATDTPVESKKPRAPVEWLGQHVVWLASMLWIVLVAVKALRVAKMNPQTAQAILGSPEVLRVAFYVLVAGLPTLFFTLGYVAWYWGFSLPGDRSVAQRVAAASAYLVALTFTMVIAPLLTTIFFLTLPISALVFHLLGRFRPHAPRIEHPTVVEVRASIEEASTLQAELEQLGGMTASTDPVQFGDLSRRATAVTTRLRAAKGAVEVYELSQKPRRFRSFTPRVFLIGMVGLQVMTLSLPLLSSKPWLPPERLGTPSGQLVGYVMGDGEWVTLLAEDSHRISRVRATDLSTRSICQTSSPNLWLARTAIDALFSNRTPEYPPCHPKS